MNIITARQAADLLRDGMIAGADSSPASCSIDGGIRLGGSAKRRLEKPLA